MLERKTIKAPKGMALYVRAMSQSRHGTPSHFAKKCVDHGLRWVAIGGPWHETKKGQNRDRWMNRPGQIIRYTNALKKAGVSPHIWGYPWHTRVDKFVEHMARCTNAATDGWLLDPELGVKNHPVESVELVSLCRSAIPDLILGFTSYGLPKGHPTFPWESFAHAGGHQPLVECDYGSPQLYDTPKNKVVRGMREYDALGFDVIVPSFGLYKWVKKNNAHGARLPNGKRNRKAISLNKAELNAHLMSFVDSSIKVNAMIGWAENFCSPALWRVLHKWSYRLERAIFSL